MSPARDVGEAAALREAASRAWRRLRPLHRRLFVLALLSVSFNVIFPALSIASAVWAVYERGDCGNVSPREPLRRYPPPRGSPPGIPVQRQ